MDDQSEPIDELENDEEGPLDDGAIVEGFGDLVSIKELSRVLGLDRSNTLKYIKRMGVSPLKRRTTDSGGQRAAVVPRDQAVEIIQKRKLEGFQVGGIKPETVSEAGFFYLIQLVPDLSAKRIKFGFANSVQER